MPRILLSYRRADSQAMAGRVFDWLVHHYGQESVFIDIDDIPLGSDFRTYIKKHLAAADLVLAVIGPRWLGPREGKPNRIFDLDDPVVIEIQTALAEKVPLLPVLVDGATMPGPADLPESLTAFSAINAATVDVGRDFRPHMDRLRRAIDSIAAERSPPGFLAKIGGPRVASAALALLLLLAGGAAYWTMMRVPKVEPVIAKVEPQAPAAPPAAPVESSPPAAPAAAPPVDDAAAKEIAQRDAELYARAVRLQGDEGYSACADYLRIFPAGAHIEQCKAKMIAYDEQQWSAVRNGVRTRQDPNNLFTVQLSAIERYLKVFPDGRHVAEARAWAEDIRTYDAANRTNTEVAFAAYLAAYPSGVRVEAARRGLAFTQKRDKGLAERKTATCNNFAQTALNLMEQNVKEPCNLTGPRWTTDPQALIQWCMSVSVDESRRDSTSRRAAVDACTAPRREREAWERGQASGTISGYRAYVTSWPSGPNAAAAMARLTELCDARWPEAKRLSTWSELTLFASAECRNTQFSRDAAALRYTMDEAAWSTARAADNRRAYQDYIGATGGDASLAAGEGLDRKPIVRGEGRHADEAVTAIEDFVRWEIADGTNTVDSFDQYIENNPRGRFVTLARQRKAALAKAK